MTTAEPTTTLPAPATTATLTLYPQTAHPNQTTAWWEFTASTDRWILDSASDTATPAQAQAVLDQLEAAGIFAGLDARRTHDDHLAWNVELFDARPDHWAPPTTDECNWIQA